MHITEQPRQIQISDIAAVTLGFPTLPDDLPGDHRKQLVAKFQFAKLPLIAVQGDPYVAWRAFADNGLHVIKRLVGRVLRGRPWLNAPRTAAARWQQLVIQDLYLARGLLGVQGR